MCVLPDLVGEVVASLLGHLSFGEILEFGKFF